MPVNVHGPVHLPSVKIKCPAIFSKGWAAYPCSCEALWELRSNNRSSEKSDGVEVRSNLCYVLIHPLMRVGWTYLSLETTNCLFVSCLHSSTLSILQFLQCCQPLYFSSIFTVSVSFNLFSPWLLPHCLLQLTCICLNCVGSWISHPFSTVLFIPSFTQFLSSGVEYDFAALVLFKLHSADCSIKGLHFLLKCTHHLH